MYSFATDMLHPLLSGSDWNMNLVNHRLNCVHHVTYNVIGRDVVRRSAASQNTSQLYPPYLPTTALLSLSSLYTAQMPCTLR